jgi:acyl dehydratase
MTVTLDETFEVELDPVTLPDIVRYAGASGDFNDTHYDRQLAVSVGFPANFAQGMFTAGLLGVWVGERYGPNRVRAYGVRFVAPLWCDDAPRLAGTVSRIDGEVAHLDLTVAVGDREVVRGWAEIQLDS